MRETIGCCLALSGPMWRHTWRPVWLLLVLLVWALTLYLLIVLAEQRAARVRVTIREDSSIDVNDEYLQGALARDAAANRARKALDAFGARPLRPLVAVVRGKPPDRKAPCPQVPTLLGRLDARGGRSSAWNVEEREWERGERGWWRSGRCTGSHRVAIIIPYRDRQEHLDTLLRTLHPLLRRQRLHYAVYVVEQFGNDTFNKGVLMNAGAREAMRDLDLQCLVFHDVDMIPEDDRNLYSCPPMPRHLSAAVDKFNYTLPYNLLVGGVFSVRVDHFVAVNGYSNLYWGWGGEDDDMGYRIKYRKLEIIRPPEMLARYSMIKHDHRPESPNAIRSALLRMAKKRSSRDGLNTVKYRVLWRHQHPSYTHLMVDIGRNHRWQFLPDNQRLVINF